MKRASVTGSRAGVGALAGPMLCTSGRGVGLRLGLSSTFDKAGLGSSLGAGDGRTGGLVHGSHVSGLPPRVAAVRPGEGISLRLGLLLVLGRIVALVLLLWLLRSWRDGRSRCGGTGIGSSGCCCARSHP